MNIKSGLQEYPRNIIYSPFVTYTSTHSLRAIERYENRSDEVYPPADGHGRAGILIFDQ